MSSFVPVSPHGRRDVPRVIARAARRPHERAHAAALPAPV